LVAAIFFDQLLLFGRNEKLKYSDIEGIHFDSIKDQICIVRRFQTKRENRFRYVSLSTWLDESQYYELLSYAKKQLADKVAINEKSRFRPAQFTPPTCAIISTIINVCYFLMLMLSQRND